MYLIHHSMLYDLSERCCLTLHTGSGQKDAEHTHRHSRSLCVWLGSEQGNGRNVEGYCHKSLRSVRPSRHRVTRNLHNAQQLPIYQTAHSHTLYYNRQSFSLLLTIKWKAASVMTVSVSYGGQRLHNDALLTH